MRRCGSSAGPELSARAASFRAIAAITEQRARAALVPLSLVKFIVQD
jgi:hypothetical protein